MSESRTTASRGAAEETIGTVLHREAHDTGAIREWQSLSCKGTVRAVAAASGAGCVLKEVAKGEPLERRLERRATEHRLLL